MSWRVVGVKDSALARFRCRVGHAYTMASLHDEQTYAIESALWAALPALEEKSALDRRLAESMSGARMAERFREQAQANRSHADTVRRRILFQPDEATQTAA